MDPALIFETKYSLSALKNDGSELFWDEKYFVMGWCYNTSILIFGRNRTPKSSSDHRPPQPAPSAESTPPGWRSQGVFVSKVWLVIKHFGDVPMMWYIDSGWHHILDFVRTLERSLKKVDRLTECFLSARVTCGMFFEVRLSVSNNETPNKTRLKYWKYYMY